MPGFVSLGWWLTLPGKQLLLLLLLLLVRGRVSLYSQLTSATTVSYCGVRVYAMVSSWQPRVAWEGSRVIRLPHGHTYRGWSWLVIYIGGPAHCGRYLSTDRRVQEMGQVAKQELTGKPANSVPPWFLLREPAWVPVVTSSVMDCDLEAELLSVVLFDASTEWN